MSDMQQDTVGKSSNYTQAIADVTGECHIKLIAYLTAAQCPNDDATHGMLSRDPHTDN